MRFQVLLKKENVPGMSFFPFFETNDIQEAKEVAMRLAFEEFNLVKVMDTKRQELHPVSYTHLPGPAGWRRRCSRPRPRR